MNAKGDWTDLLRYVVLIFFFFQAEDGIRDDLVTGVQTCALPICGNGGAEVLTRLWGFEPVDELSQWLAICIEYLNTTLAELKGGLEEIGRASCRERV